MFSLPAPERLIYATSYWKRWWINTRCSSIAHKPGHRRDSGKRSGHDAPWWYNSLQLFQGEYFSWFRPLKVLSRTTTSSPSFIPMPVTSTRERSAKSLVFVSPSKTKSNFRRLQFFLKGKVSKENHFLTRFCLYSSVVCGTSTTKQTTGQKVGNKVWGQRKAFYSVTIASLRTYRKPFHQSRRPRPEWDGRSSE